MSPHVTLMLPQIDPRTIPMLNANTKVFRWHVYVFLTTLVRHSPVDTSHEVWVVHCLALNTAIWSNNAPQGHLNEIKDHENYAQESYHVL